MLQGVSGKVKERMKAAASGTDGGARPMLLFPEVSHAVGKLGKALPWQSSLLATQFVILLTGDDHKRRVFAAFQKRCIPCWSSSAACPYTIWQGIALQASLPTAIEDR